MANDVMPKGKAPGSSATGTGRSSKPRVQPQIITRNQLASDKLPATIRTAHEAKRLAMHPFSQLFSEAGVPLPLTEEPVLALVPELPSRTPTIGPKAKVAQAPATTGAPNGGAMPEFEGGEHTYLGNGVTLTFPGASGPVTSLASTVPLNLPNGLALTYGQVVALSGDFYGNTDAPLSSNPTQDRFLEAFNSLAQDPAAVSEAPQILDVMQIEINAVNTAIQNGAQPSAAYQELGDSLSAQWNVITGGGSDITPLLPPGRYLQLASINMDHFGADAITCYNLAHQVALQYAVAASSASADQQQALLEQAYAMNAFADHYLTDLFSAGHLRVPRQQLHDLVDSSGLPTGDYLSKFMHDEDCAYGLNVTNANGDQWQAFGDKFLLDTVDGPNLAIAQTAIQASVNEVWSAFNTGVASTNYQALLHVPNLAGFNDPQNPTNTPALFIVNSDSVVCRRTDPADRMTYAWTTEWEGWSTVALLETLPEFEQLGDGSLPAAFDVSLLQLKDHSGTLGMVQYVPTVGSYAAAWSTDDLGVSSNAAAFLSGDFAGDGQTAVVAITNNNGSMGLVYLTPIGVGQGYQVTWTGTAIGAVGNNAQWLVVDRNGDGQNQIVQVWNNGGAVGMALYALDSNGTSFSLIWNNANLGTLGNKPRWVVMDHDGDGKDAVVQMWNNNGESTGLALYAPDPNGPGYVNVWSNGSMVPTTNVIDVLVINIYNDGKEQILQLYGDSTNLGQVIYAADPNGPGFVRAAWQTLQGQATSALAWLALDVNNDGQSELVRFYGYGGRLWIDLFCIRPAQAAFTWLSTTHDVGSAPSAMAWLTSRTGPDGEMSVVELTRDSSNANHLGIVIFSYGPQSQSMVLAGEDLDLGVDAGNVGLFMANLPAAVSPQ